MRKLVLFRHGEYPRDCDNAILGLKISKIVFERRYSNENLDNTEDGALYRLPLLFSCLCEACAQEPVVGYGRHPHSLIGRPVDRL